MILKYEDLINTGEEFLDWARIHGVDSKKLDNSGIKNAIELIKGLLKVLNDEEAISSYLSTYNKDSKLLFALTYLSEIKFILDNVIKRNIVDEKHLICRIKKIIKAPLLPSEENNSTMEERNHLFELLFLAELLKNNFQANIYECTENPDIEVIINQSRKYALECKRIFSKKSFIKNFKRARSQLKQVLEKHDYDYGIIVIDISRDFIVKEENNMVLETINVDITKRYVYQELKSFFDSFKPFLHKRYIWKIPALILYISFTNVVKHRYPSVYWGHFLYMHDLASFNQVSLFDQVIKTDFIKLTNIFYLQRK
ncbi:hypothetical protein [Persephonella sp.]